MSHRLSILFAWTILLIGASRGAAQDVVVDDAPPTDMTSARAALSRPITMHVDHASVAAALDAAIAAAQLDVIYHRELVTASEKVVTLDVKDVACGTVIDRILNGTGLQLVPVPGHRFTVLKRAADQTRAQAGDVGGRIIDAKTKQPVVGVRLTLDDTVQAVRSDAQGHYRFTNVSSGTHRITVRAVGYLRQTRVVTVTDDQTSVSDFTLETSVNTLDQVVVTATGTQRVRELGHVVSTINADSLVKEAPITNIGELLQSRVPGLQVLTGDGGEAGGEISLRLRGTSTFSLDPEPIVIVDGIRYQSNNLITYGGVSREDIRSQLGNPQSPLNNLNPNDIDKIEVVKGPSASTLYGPDAANGVIVITTKRGVPGKTIFNWYARPVSSDVPKSRLRHGYKIWSHTPSGAPFQANCTLNRQYEDQQCILDSITTGTPSVVDDRYSILAKNRPTWQYGANMSGGVSQLQYYLSGNYDSQVGAVHLAPAIQEFLQQQLGVHALSDAVRNPNTLQVLGSQGNMSTNAGSRSTVSLTAGYTQTNHRMAQPGIFVDQLTRGVHIPQTDTNIARYLGNPRFSLRTVEENANRFTSALNATTQVLPWLSMNGIVGIDLNGTTQHMMLPAGQLTPTDGGDAEDDRRSNVDRTATLGATALAHPGRLTFRSSLGVQYTYTHLDGVSVRGQGLAPGSTSIGTATSLSTTQLWSETVSLGTYGEEVVGLNDRLFLTGSLRYDGSTSFGEAYHPRPFPKAGLSWIASEEPFFKGMPGLRELRLRTSVGSASRYPTSLMKYGEEIGFPVPLEGQTQNAFDRDELANPLLRPEKSRESEFGADITVASDIAIGLTWHSRRVTDQLLNVSNSASLPRTWTNVGNMKLHGFEATVSIPVVDTRALRADLQLSYSDQRNTILSLGALSERRSSDGDSRAIGYPIGALFSDRPRVVGVMDTVGGGPDGIVFSNEIVFDTTHRFLGLSIPPKTYTASPRFSVLGGHVRISSLFDRQTGFLRLDRMQRDCRSTALCLGPFVKGTSLIDQARYFNAQNVDFLEPGDFTRWREFNVTADVPQRFLRIDPIHLHFTRATVSLQGRNLSLWTKYHGTDPESRNNGFISVESNGVPQARAWSFRFDITP